MNKKRRGCSLANKMDVFLTVYAALAFSTVFALSLMDVEELHVYVALFTIEFFIASELISPFSVTQYRRKSIVEIMMLAIFAAIMIERIAQILG